LQSNTPFRIFENKWKECEPKRGSGKISRGRRVSRAVLAQRTERGSLNKSLTRRKAFGSDGLVFLSVPAELARRLPLEERLFAV
jgi:hypothetical protein